MFFVEIKGKKYKVIKRNGILVYKKPRCPCGCNSRIPYRESNKRNGVPDYISGHNMITKMSLKKRNAILSEPTIIEYGIKVYENWICHCKDEDNINCGLHIPFPITKSGLNNHIKRGIPKVIQCHILEETRQKLIESELDYYKKHPERREQISDTLTGKYVGEYSPLWKGGESAYHSRRRNLGYEQFNYRFEDSHGHHIDKKFVINIPDKLHRSVSHDNNTGRGMKIINQIAFDFLGFQTKLKYYHGIKNDDDATTLAINYVNMKYGKN